MSEEQNKETEEKLSKNTLKSIILSVLEYIINIIKLPFTVFAKFFTKEIIKAIKKDVKTYVFLLSLLVIMTIFLSVMWLFIVTSVGVYFYENGNTVLESLGFSLLFQLISFLVFGLILYFTSKKLRSLKLLKNILNLEK